MLCRNLPEPGPLACIAKMILEMPASVTAHPLSRKVEYLKSYAKRLYMLSKDL